MAGVILPKSEVALPKKELSGEEALKNELVSKKVEQWKKRLLDLTRRNKLLYFSPTKSAVKLSSPSISEIVERIVNEGKQLSFPMPRREPQLLLIEVEETPEREREAESDAVDFKPGDIETNVPVRELQSRLYRLRREWKTWQEEQGVHTLFLALGVLHWREAEQEQKECLAPLILVPVGLEKESAGKPYKVEFVEEDIVVNPALAFKLKRDCNLELPELPEDLTGDVISDYLEGVGQKVKSQGWSVFKEVWLGRFSFEKYVMYQDLENHREDAWRHPIVAALASAGPLPQPADLPPLERLDDAADPQEVFPVLDADSSQLEVLIRTRSGQNLVVHGPPGTGKSQTIVNLIAQALRDGKKVLFVSEKMAALEVVHRRLRETGIAMGCLEVHSHHGDKGKVIEELGKTLQQRMAPSLPDSVDAKFRALIRRRDSLNGYVHELWKPRGTLKLSVFQVHGKFARLIDALTLQFKSPWEKALDLTSEQLEQCVDAINRVAKIPEVIDRYEAHPWLDAEIPLSEYCLQYCDCLVQATQVVHHAIENVRDLTEGLVRELGADAPSTFQRAQNLLALLGLLTEPVTSASQWLALDREGVVTRLRVARNAKEHADELAKLKQNLLDIFSPEFLKLPVEELLGRFQKRYQSRFRRWLQRDYWRDITVVRRQRRVRRLTFDQVLRCLTEAASILKHEKWLHANDEDLQRHLGPAYQGDATDWTTVCSSLEWAERLYRCLPSDRVSGEIIAYVQAPSRLKPKIKETYSRLTETLKECEVERIALSSVFKQKGINGLRLEETPFPALQPWLGSKQNPRDLDDWVGFLQSKTNCQKIGLGDFLVAALRHGLKTNQLLPSFLKQIWESWLAAAYRESPTLLEFRGERHNAIVDEFQTLDRELKKVAAALVCHAIEKNQPKRAAAHSNESQVGILLREMQKRRRHRPLRRLFSEIPHLLQELKPGLLMSPLSVASYLPREAFAFDLVIFDEASQIPPADAIGSVLRGKQLLVAGDDKQLPPTRFFQADLDDYEEEEGADTEPLESILNDCKALPGFIERPLLWHYRSRYEELIAFSNRSFYHSELVTFPSPHPTGASGAIRFVHVPNGVYDRGGSRTNRNEAKRVVDLVIEHFRTHGAGKSLGVITLSFAQEETVLEELERRKTVEPELDAWVGEQGNEPFFVKALEKVQGDERDFIIISVGYGRDDKGVLHLNFGPINQFGGERRLNVAVTRARFQTTLVSSILPHELDLAKLSTGRDGVVKLQQYIEYSRNGGRFSEVVNSQGAVELNDFEEAVKNALESKGLVVDGQVGCSGFRIDLGVRHPDHPNRYVLGVECDGATYHSHRTARDRDRLRQEVLTALGWRLYRIWSTDWIKAPERLVESVVATVEHLRSKGVIGVETITSEEKGENPGNPGHGGSRGNSNLSISPSGTEQVSETLKVQLPPYQSYRAPRRRNQDFLYSAEHRSGALDTLVQDIEAVVHAESPVYSGAVIRRVGEIYDFERVGDRVERIVSKAIKLAARGKRLLQKNGFLWKDTNLSVQPRRPMQNGDARPIEEVAIEELAAAAEWVLRHEYGLPRESLVRETARVMGYDRTGDNVRGRIETAIDWLLAEGKVAVYGGQVVLAKESPPSP